MTALEGHRQPGPAPGSTEPASQAAAATPARVVLRLATVEDAADAYNQGIAARTATFETEPRSPGDMAALIAATGPRHAFLVAERDGQVLGCAATSLCAACGFREADVLRRHARLDGVWPDVLVVERLLGPAADVVPGL